MVKSRSSGNFAHNDVIINSQYYLSEYGLSRLFLIFYLHSQESMRGIVLFKTLPKPRVIH